MVASVECFDNFPIPLSNNSSPPPPADDIVHNLSLPKHFAQLAQWAPVPYFKDLVKAAMLDPNAPRILRAQYVAPQWSTKLGPIVFLTPESRWSTVGGLGVMVAELSQMLASYGEQVIVISPYYEVNGKGEKNYLEREGIYHSLDMSVWVGPEQVQVGVYEGKFDGVQMFFLKCPQYFPRIYPSFFLTAQVRMVALFAKACLEALCQKRIIPSVVVTNDWFTGLTAGFGKGGHFGTAFENTTFFHLVHNLEGSYQGAINMNREERDTLNRDVLGFPTESVAEEGQNCINPSRVALMLSTSWGTVSPSYRFQLIQTSPLRTVMSKHLSPFAFPNGVPVELRTQQLFKRAGDSHSIAKARLQEKYFGLVDPSIPVFAFVGRITEQKGVHLITAAAWELIQKYEGRIQILIGGMAMDGYGNGCTREAGRIKQQHPNCIWADGSVFFSDGPLVNLGADFGLMPSLFEPGGIVQQEFFVAGTPVIAFSTGGLKDTVAEWSPQSATGNGFVFVSHNANELIKAVDRAVLVFRSPESYVHLRVNARESVIDADTVACAWLGEFYRLRGREEEFAKRIRVF
mmetsp:Transcript_11297/g.19092  ORF Transcript_11297/g.19092 Transcript_11297/m.19092 type:complete len:573 (+) Transcript_11297:147-1865(+)|eukprot:CAMPEP_0184352658 /NCGR_PEP_ID=MMETSP1089-20130417/68620_1 /TAXON_ID=38269 ORGANISM="Gloeochaete wittrockiana, Strain SAG46.84" /NCGR_SAMPLE_ID=MMETSP1089 /ASSEMBLY_ACC=CAM_ASM_000445 /LENGTH=572 /DNA_ID=CAMNT_0026687419 /DNA_START=97 /DNA_END=1815 /DNA_ORIENTATION=+